MEELELLKNEWKEGEPKGMKHYSEQELFSMTKRKSVSVSRWALIAGALEIIAWESLEHLISDSEESEPFPYIIEQCFQMIDIFDYPIPYLFLGSLFYLYYKISNTEKAENLMRKILWTKKIIKWYIRLLLIELCLEFILITITLIIEKGEQKFLDIIIAVLIMSIIIITIGLLMRFIYFLIYGKLLQQLEHNYQELRKMEI